MSKNELEVNLTALQDGLIKKIKSHKINSLCCLALTVFSALCWANVYFSNTALLSDYSIETLKFEYFNTTTIILVNVLKNLVNGLLLVLGFIGLAKFFRNETVKTLSSNFTRFLVVFLIMVSVSMASDTLLKTEVENHKLVKAKLSYISKGYGDDIDSLSPNHDLNTFVMWQYMLVNNNAPSPKMATTLLKINEQHNGNSLQFRVLLNRVLTQRQTGDFAIGDIALQKELNGTKLIVKNSLMCLAILTAWFFISLLYQLVAMYQARTALKKLEMANLKSRFVLESNAYPTLTKTPKQERHYV